MNTNDTEKNNATPVLQDAVPAAEPTTKKRNEKKLSDALKSGAFASVDWQCDWSDNQAACLFEEIKRDKDNKVVLKKNRWVEACLDASEDALSGLSRDSLAVIRLLKDTGVPVYAMIAPAFTGQFNENVTPGKLRNAFKHMGFYGVIEVALFADILTLKEALEFDAYIKDDKAFMLTSCCCPMWVALIKKSYSNLIPHIPPSVSPMIACGRSIKKLHPEAKTVFVGPCLAKKAEAREPDIADAVDVVLTFREVEELFKLMHINPSDFEDDHRDHSSKAGRIYARTQGVSEAVQSTLCRLCPDHKIPLRSAQADGIVECKKLLKDLTEGKIDANFIEGMGCSGGCVGGPRALIDKDAARKAVNDYGDSATIRTPADNPFVLDLLKLLGFDTVESLLERDNFFTRKLS
jgi:iron only hydrogenase large subunit-like protein